MFPICSDIIPLMCEIRFTHRWRFVYLTKVDEAAFLRALRERFPDILFLDDEPQPRPGVRLLDSLDQGSATMVYGYLPLLGWTPEGEAERTYNRPDAPRMRPSFRIWRCKWDWDGGGPANWAWDPPTLTEGKIIATYRRDDPESNEFGRIVMQILTKITVNNFRIELPHTGHVYNENRRMRSTRAGHDALRWCSEAPARMLGGCYRPHADWRFPVKNPYYQGLGIFGRPEE